ncbi:hypothetical protein SAMD00019534_107080 [Acytostelium subglobosum LB1]|uniref:hypothetical protein n=1 Tax=Acytostelium subglobosum LB1 TaxID=1410327 RepID=UPI000644D3E2|nr:hypothetical protein SAMD00019534_107080 [Acytostelium subglobosum LB1]GAM27532.1 hypothetical protein SAMD00019534_107080 [Acytostelium subglobosum LB1]|eukprot:XP_012749597.1 hypothetical protein SAMD00019534_107080 [Acytostelium subglobosum LB1]
MDIDLKDWGIPSMYDTNKGVPLRYADFFQMLNVYLDRFPPNPKLVIVVIPSLTISEIIEVSRRNNSEHIFRVGVQLQHYLNIRSNTLRPTGIPLEDCVESIIEIRTNNGLESHSEEWFWNQLANQNMDSELDGTNMHNTQGLPPLTPALQNKQVINQSISQMFLFFLGSWVSDILWRGNNITHIKAFPKIVRDSENQIDWNSVAMQQTLSTNRVDLASYPHCPMRHFKDLWRMAHPFATYRSAPKSGSSDF